MACVPDDPDALLTRDRAAEALNEAGYPTSPATLATRASRGGGPPFRKFGTRPLYRWRGAVAARPSGDHHLRGRCGMTPAQSGPAALAGPAEAARRGISHSARLIEAARHRNGGKLAAAGNTWLHGDGTGPPDPNRERRSRQEAALFRLSGYENSANLQPNPGSRQKAEVRFAP
jgi:hypothetical protein